MPAIINTQMPTKGRRDKPIVAPIPVAIDDSATAITAAQHSAASSRNVAMSRGRRPAPVITTAG